MACSQPKHPKTRLTFEHPSLSMLSFNPTVHSLTTVEQSSISVKCPHLVQERSFLTVFPINPRMTEVGEPGGFTASVSSSLVWWGWSPPLPHPLPHQISQNRPLRLWGERRPKLVLIIALNVIIKHNQASSALSKLICWVWHEISSLWSCTVFS